MDNTKLDIICSSTSDTNEASEGVKEWLEAASVKGVPERESSALVNGLVPLELSWVGGKTLGGEISEDPEAWVVASNGVSTERYWTWSMPDKESDGAE